MRKVHLVLVSVAILGMASYAQASSQEHLAETEMPQAQAARLKTFLTNHHPDYVICQKGLTTHQEVYEVKLFPANESVRFTPQEFIKVVHTIEHVHSTPVPCRSKIETFVFRIHDDSNGENTPYIWRKWHIIG